MGELEAFIRLVFLTFGNGKCFFFFFLIDWNLNKSVVTSYSFEIHITSALV